MASILYPLDDLRPCHCASNFFGAVVWVAGVGGCNAWEYRGGRAVLAFRPLASMRQAEQVANPQLGKSKIEIKQKKS